MFRLKLNDIDAFYSHSTFPGGEEHVRINKAGIPQRIADVNITAHVKNSADLITLALLVNAVRGLPQMAFDAQVHLELPYFPYARQDRRCNFGEALSAVVVANLINGMNFSSVTVKDPHSDVVENLVNNVIIRRQDAIVRDYLGWYIRGQECVLVSPDAGAAKKVEKLSQSLGGVPIVYGHKQRDLPTGGIIGLTIDNPALVKDRNLVIVDDICDGGRTFIELAKTLRQHEPKSITLFVTHGIFSQGLSVFDGLIDAVYSDTIWWENVTADGSIQFASDIKGRVK